MIGSAPTENEAVMAETGNGWEEYKKLVLDHLERNEQQHQSIFTRLDLLAGAWVKNCEMHKEAIERDFVSKDRFGPVEKVAYGLVGVIAGGVGLWVLIQVLGKGIH